MLDAISSASVIIIMRFDAVVISTSSSELPDSGDRSPFLPLLLLLSLHGTRSLSSGLLLLNKFFLLRLGSVSGNGVASKNGFSRSGRSCTRKGCWLCCGSIGLTGGGGLNFPSAMRLCSNSNNWPMKFKFGEIMGRANLTNWYASRRESDLYRITYAMAIVADREMPAWQCNNTVDPLLRASSVIN